MINKNTCFAYACCITVHGLCETHEEALEEASKLTPVRIGDTIETGYVIEISPGSLSDDWSPEDQDLVTLWGDYSFMTFPRPNWMIMIDDGKPSDLDSLDQIEAKIKNNHLKQKFEKFKKREVIGSDRNL